jgi:hypothetical protein
MTGVTWLHLSDWHQGGEKYQKCEGFDRKVVCKALIKDLETRSTISPDLAKIDFIVFSGDVAYSGKLEEYHAANEELFGPLLKAVGLNPDRLFIVPGNHDIDRTAFELLPRALSQPLVSEKDVQHWLTDTERRTLLLRPFRDFANFVSVNTGQDQTAAAHPRSRAAGYARRRRIKMLLIRSEPFLSRTRMHFIPAAELRGITDKSEINLSIQAFENGRLAGKKLLF